MSFTQIQCSNKHKKNSTKPYCSLTIYFSISIRRHSTDCHTTGSCTHLCTSGRSTSSRRSTRGTTAPASRLRGSKACRSSTPTIPSRRRSSSSRKAPPRSTTTGTCSRTAAPCSTTTGSSATAGAEPGSDARRRAGRALGAAAAAAGRAPVPQPLQLGLQPPAQLLQHRVQDEHEHLQLEQQSLGGQQPPPPPHTVGSGRSLCSRSWEGCRCSNRCCSSCSWICSSTKKGP